MEDTTQRYVVVWNREEDSYRPWRADREPPPGWVADTYEGTREECVRYIEQIWTDMRPKKDRERELDERRERERAERDRIRPRPVHAEESATSPEEGPLR